jgi:AP2 domain/HNH endonuclease
MPREIPLTQGYTAIVDDEDFERVASRKWHAKVDQKRGTVYAATTVWHAAIHHTKTLLLHRFITNAKPGSQVDHRDGNGLNCKQDNLRFCTFSENARNRDIQQNNKSGYKGVYWSPRKAKWEAGIRVNSQRIHLGVFDSLELAAEAYKVAAMNYHKEFAKAANQQAKQSPQAA